MRYLAVMGLGCALALGACGNSTGQRALTGGATGAGIGALGSAVVGGSIGTGAIVGGAAGAVVGAVTDREDLDLERLFD